MQDNSDKWDFIIREQDDYEIANYLDELDARSKSITEDSIHNTDSESTDSDDYQTTGSSDGISGRENYQRGSCGNCIFYALCVIAAVIALGYLVSALS